MHEGMSRRRFMTSVGAGVATAAAIDLQPRAVEAAGVVEAGERAPLTLLVNGTPQRVLVEPRTRLIEVLRDQLGLAGTKPGCERGECGACTVLIGDTPRYACMTLALEAEGAAVTTVEGLMQGEEAGPVQQAFAHEDAFQCGYCTPGQVMAVEGLLRANPSPTPEQIREGVSGNLCRCGAYAHIFAAARRAAELRRLTGVRHG
jgi:xanthine dehydrogenase YagT iron-sulfur-binding subunit